MAKKKSKKSSKTIKKVKEVVPFFTQPFREKGKRKKVPREKASIFEKQEQSDEEIIAGSLKNKFSKSKQKKEKVVIDSSKPRGKKRDYITTAIVTILLLLLFLFLIVLLYSYLEQPKERYLEAGENVEAAVVKGESSLEVRLKEFNPENLSSIKFVFLGDTEYYYETRDIKQDYTFSPSDIRLNSFGSIVKASVILRYKT